MENYAEVFFSGIGMDHTAHPGRELLVSSAVSLIIYRLQRRKSRRSFVAFVDLARIQVKYRSKVYMGSVLWFGRSSESFIIAVAILWLANKLLLLSASIPCQGDTERRA